MSLQDRIMHEGGWYVRFGVHAALQSENESLRQEVALCIGKIAGLRVQLETSQSATSKLQAELWEFAKQNAELVTKAEKFNALSLAVGRFVALPPMRGTAIREGAGWLARYRDMEIALLEYQKAIAPKPLEEKP